MLEKKDETEDMMPAEGSRWSASYEDEKVVEDDMIGLGLMALFFSMPRSLRVNLWPALGAIKSIAAGCSVSRMVAVRSSS